MNMLPMKRCLLLLLASALWFPTTLPAQEAPRPRALTPPGVSPPPTTSDLTRFDLDFPGGTPEELVRAIGQASGRPLNAIVPKEQAEVELPPLRMKGVTVPRLFEALKAASTRTVVTSMATFHLSYGFEICGTTTDDSVWYFVYDKPIVRPEHRFYQLAPYLEAYKVEDITTAIQTGYKMLGEKSPPTISFHKDTKLLIAVGEGDKLQLIDDVLKQLSGGQKSGKESASPPKTPTSVQPTKVE